MGLKNGSSNSIHGRFKGTIQEIGEDEKLPLLAGLTTLRFAKLALPCSFQLGFSTQRYWTPVPQFPISHFPTFSFVFSHGGSNGAILMCNIDWCSACHIVMWLAKARRQVEPKLLFTDSATLQSTQWIINAINASLHCLN
jgi:hypothetical protein